MNDCGEMRVRLGVYVLGAIDPGERSRLESHLDRCPACRDELAGLAGLPALLGRMNEQQIEQLAGPPPELVDSVPPRATEERRGPVLRRWVPAALAACALLLAGGLVGALLTSVRDGPPVAVTPPTPSVATSAEKISATAAGGDVRAEVVLHRRKWGTKVDLYLAGAPYGENCRFYAVARSGQRDMLGSWYVAYRRGYGKYPASTMFQRDQLVSFEVVTLAGKRLVSIPA